MKTIRSFYKYVLAIVLMMSGAQTLQAQDAFYIYRNDGDFDGFFYDQIVRMSYSKTDLEGEEHDVYVVQEIETVDSLYRIPLNAIDSIGFQQPEIIFNPKLNNMDETGLTQYVTYVSDTDLRLNFKNLPSGSIPAEGDVLAGFNKDIYGEQGFVGKVISVQEYSEGTVECILDSISDWGDIFKQFITVEQLGVDEKGNVRRRVAGFDENGRLRTNPRRDWSGNVSLNLINWSGRLQYQHVPWFGSNESLTIGLDVGVKVKASATFSITGVFSTSFFMKLVFSESLSAGSSVHAQISTGDMIPVDTPFSLFGAIKFPAVFPLFEVNPVPRGFIRWGGSIDASIQLPTLSFGASQTIVMDTDDPWLIGVKWGNHDGNGGYQLTESDFSWIDAGLSINGFVQGGIMTQVGLNTNSWLSKLLHAGVGLELYFGPKLEAELNLSASGALASGSYGALKDSRLTIIPYCLDRELKYKWRVGKKKDERTLWSDTQREDEASLYLLPEFLKTKVNFNEKERTVDATIFPRRQVFIGSTLGIGLYPQESFDNATATVESSQKYSFKNQFNEFNTTFDNPIAGKYNVAPYVTLFGVKLPVADSNVYTELVVPPFISIPNDSVVVEGKTNTIEVPIETNCKDISISSGSWTEASFVDTIPQNNMRILRVDIKDNDEKMGRGEDIILTSTIDDMIACDTLHIRQKHSGFKITDALINVSISITGTHTHDHIYTRNGETEEKHESKPNQEYSEVFFINTKDNSYPLLTVDGSLNGDLLTVKASYKRQESETRDSSEPSIYTETVSKEVSGNITFVIDLSKDPIRIISGHFDTKDVIETQENMTSFSHFNGKKWVSAVSSGNYYCGYIGEVEWNHEILGELDTYWGDDKIMRFEMSPEDAPANWANGSRIYRRDETGESTGYDEDGNVNDVIKYEDHEQMLGTYSSNLKNYNRVRIVLHYE